MQLNEEILRNPSPRVDLEMDSSIKDMDYLDFKVGSINTPDLLLTFIFICGDFLMLL
jgi:hypothetical protein